MGQWYMESELGQPSLDNLLNYLKNNAKHFNKHKIEVKPQQQRQMQRNYSGGSCDDDECEIMLDVENNINFDDFAMTE